MVSPFPLPRRPWPPAAPMPEPAWAQHYAVFPATLLVLANGSRRALERRRDVVLALCQQDRGDALALTVCLLDDLMERGPFAPVFRTLGDNLHKPVDWLGEAGAD